MGQSETICEDAPWGFFEDEGNSDPDVIYGVTFLETTAGIQPVHRLEDHQIRRWVRPVNTCRVNFAFTRPDGSPWLGRRLKIFDREDFSYLRYLYTNGEGAAHIVLRYGYPLRLEVEGWLQALEFAVPEVPVIEHTELDELGSWVRADQRSVM